MISGYIDANGDAVIPLIVRGFQGQKVSLIGVIETGFGGEISLTAVDIASLHLVPSGIIEMVLADGSVRITTTYEAIVLWDGIEKIVTVAGEDPEPLVGLQLLRGYNLSINVVDAGTVTMTRIDTL